MLPGQGMFELLCITLVFLLARYVKGVIGMGLPTIAMAVPLGRAARAVAR